MNEPIIDRIQRNPKFAELVQKKPTCPGFCHPLCW